MSTTGQTWVIRAATAEDVPAVLPMVQAICNMHAAMDPLRYAFVDDVTAKYATWLPRRAADPASVFLVAEMGGPGGAGELAGFLVAETVDEIPIYLTRRYGFIHDVWVEPHARGRGIAQALTRTCMERFAAMRLSQVRLETAHANEIARSLFARLGFRPSATQMLAGL